MSLGVYATVLPDQCGVFPSHGLPMLVSMDMEVKFIDFFTIFPIRFSRLTTMSHLTYFFSANFEL